MDKRPKGCIYPDCLNCPLPECEYDGIEIDDEAESKAIDADIIHIRTIDKHYMNGTYSQYVSNRKYNSSDKGRMRYNKYNRSAKGIAARKKYEQSEKGKEAKKRYSRTLKGKDTQKRYINSAKGKEALQRKREKDIASGKNAERCKRYYEKHKAEILARAKAKREKKVGDTKWQMLSG